jgi:phospholipase C
MSGVAPPPTRQAGSLPLPGQRPGTPNPEMPFDHVIVVMMENHSFDNLLGALPLSNPNVDGLTFDGAGNALNSNPGTNHMPAEVKAFPLPNTAQATNVSQSWKSTHEQIAGGQMHGFVTSARALEPMGY